MLTQPFRTYDGGKGGEGVWQRIISEMPPHGVYIETCLGNSPIMARKAPARLNIGYDLDATVISAWRSQLSGMAMPPALSLFPTCRTSEACPGSNGERRRRASEDIASPARAMGPGQASQDLASVATSRPGGIAGTSEPSPIAKSGVPGRPEYRFWNGDGISALESREWLGDELVYADPPYPLESRSYQKPMYKFEFSTRDHERLLDVLCQLPCAVLVSSYQNQMYRGRLKDWRVVEIPTTNRRGKRVTEIVWCNFDAPAELHDYRFLGKTFRDRERIRRRQDRWARRLASLPRLEIAALMERLRSAAGSPEQAMAAGLAVSREGPPSSEVARLEARRNWRGGPDPRLVGGRCVL